MDFVIKLPLEGKRLTSYRPSHQYIPMYPLTIGVHFPIDDMITELQVWYRLCLAQVHPQVWRLVLCLHHLAEKAGICLTFPYLVHPYFCNIYQQGVINLSQWGSKALIFKCGDDFDCQWFERQLVIWTKFLYTNDKIQFLEKQNLNRKYSSHHVSAICLELLLIFDVLQPFRSLSKECSTSKNGYLRNQLLVSSGAFELYTRVIMNLIIFSWNHYITLFSFY